MRCVGAAPLPVRGRRCSYLSDSIMSLSCCCSAPTFAFAESAALLAALAGGIGLTPGAPTAPPCFELVFDEVQAVAASTRHIAHSASLMRTEMLMGHPDASSRNKRSVDGCRASLPQDAQRAHAYGLRPPPKAPGSA